MFYALVFKAGTFGDNLTPANIDGKLMVEIANRFLLSSTQVRNLVSRSIRLYEKDLQLNARDIIREHLTDHPESLKTGNLEIIMPNPVQRETVENEIMRIKGFNDTAFNRNILVIPLSTVVRLFDKEEDQVCADIQKELRKIHNNNPALKLEKALSGKDLKSVFLHVFAENSVPAVLNLMPMLLPYLS